MIKTIFGAIFFSASLSLCAAQPAGEYVLGGRGTLLIAFDGAGNFSGVGAIPNHGVVNISGTAPVDASNAISGSFTLTDRKTNAVLYTGALNGRAAPSNASVTLKLGLRPPQVFKGGVRSGSEEVPSGQYFGTSLPVSLIFQCGRSSNRQVISIQGDQDFGLDLTQAVGGQLLFNQFNDGFGVVYENGDPASPPRWATAHYDSFRDNLSLTLFSALLGGKRKTVILNGVGSGGKYDGVYLANIAAGTPGATSTVAVKVTVKNGVVSGTDTNTGTIAGTLDDAGNLSFTTQRLVVPAPSSQAGTHTGTVTFTGAPSFNPVFPIVLDGTFSGAGASGTFTFEQQSGVTGATTPTGTARSETWVGHMSGTHRSPLVAGGVYTEEFDISFTFPVSLIKALRGKALIQSGSGSMSGAETIKTQAPFATAIGAIVESASAGGSVNVTFAGVLNGAGPSIEFDSTAPLIPGEVLINAGPNKGASLFEDRKIIKLRISTMTATLINGAWADGHFFLRKQ